MVAIYIYKVSRALSVALLCMVSGVLCAQRVEAVDLGLSVIWANMNVGAESPDDYGDYFAWGEVSPKRYYGSNGARSTYKHLENLIFHKYNYAPVSAPSVVDDILRLQPVDDAATKRMGKGWRMPTDDEMNELLDTAKCVITHGVLNGTRGFWVTRRRPMEVSEQMRKNSTVKRDSLFLPMAGYKDFGTRRFFPGTQCYYWTSTLIEPDSLSVAKTDSLVRERVWTAKCFMYSGKNFPRVGFFNRGNGCVIRAVRSR